MCGTCDDPLAPGATYCGTCRGREVMAERVARERRSHQERLRGFGRRFRSTAPDWFADVDFSAQGSAWRERVDPRIVDAVQQWEPLRDGGLVLVGPTGCGKSTSVFARIRQLARKELLFVDSTDDPFAYRPQYLPRDPRWISESALASARHYSRLGSEPEMLRDATGAGLLVIDEVGHAGAEQTMLEIMNARYERRRPTVITSGFSISTLASRLGAACVRRMVNDATVVDLTARLAKAS